MFLTKKYSKIFLKKFYNYYLKQLQKKNCFNKKEVLFLSFFCNYKKKNFSKFFKEYFIRTKNFQKINIKEHIFFNDADLFLLFLLSNLNNNIIEKFKKLNYKQKIIFKLDNFLFNNYFNLFLLHYKISKQDFHIIFFFMLQFENKKKLIFYNYYFFEKFFYNFFLIIFLVYNKNNWKLFFFNKNNFSINFFLNSFLLQKNIKINKKILILKNCLNIYFFLNKFWIFFIKKFFIKNKFLNVLKFDSELCLWKFFFSKKFDFFDLKIKFFIKPTMVFFFRDFEKTFFNCDKDSDFLEKEEDFHIYWNDNWDDDYNFIGELTGDHRSLTKKLLQQYLENLRFKGKILINKFLGYEKNVIYLEKQVLCDIQKFKKTSYLFFKIFIFLKNKKTNKFKVKKSSLSKKNFFFFLWSRSILSGYTVHSFFFLLKIHKIFFSLRIIVEFFILCFPNIEKLDFVFWFEELKKYEEVVDEIKKESFFIEEVYSPKRLKNFLNFLEDFFFIYDKIEDNNYVFYIYNLYIFYEKNYCFFLFFIYNFNSNLNCFVDNFFFFNSIKLKNDSKFSKIKNHIFFIQEAQSLNDLTIQSFISLEKKNIKQSFFVIFFLIKSNYLSAKINLIILFIEKYFNIKALSLYFYNFVVLFYQNKDKLKNLFFLFLFLFF